jgi:hypothetical protein
VTSSVSHGPRSRSPLPSRLAAPIRPFLQPNFPRRWSDSDVDVDARPGQPGRSLPDPAPGPLPSSLSLSFSFCLFKRPSERSTSLPSPVGIENASPSRPLAAPLTAPFLVDLHASSPEARTWKIGRGRQYEATNEGNAASSVSVSLGEGVAAVGEQAERLETAPANFRPG